MSTSVHGQEMPQNFILGCSEHLRRSLLGQFLESIVTWDLGALDMGFWAF